MTSLNIKGISSFCSAPPLMKWRQLAGKHRVSSCLYTKNFTYLQVGLIKCNIKIRNADKTSHTKSQILSGLVHFTYISPSLFSCKCKKCNSASGGVLHLIISVLRSSYCLFFLTDIKSELHYRCIFISDTGCRQH